MVRKYTMSLSALAASLFFYGCADSKKTSNNASPSNEDPDIAQISGLPETIVLAAGAGITLNDLSGGQKALAQGQEMAFTASLVGFNPQPYNEIQYTIVGRNIRYSAQALTSLADVVEGCAGVDMALAPTVTYQEGQAISIDIAEASNTVYQLCVDSVVTVEAPSGDVVELVRPSTSYLIAANPVLALSASAADIATITASLEGSASGADLSGLVPSLAGPIGELLQTTIGEAIPSGLETKSWGVSLNGSPCVTATPIAGFAAPLVIALDPVPGVGYQICVDASLAVTATIGGQPQTAIVNATPVNIPFTANNALPAGVVTLISETLIPYQLNENNDADGVTNNDDTDRFINGTTSSGASVSLDFELSGPLPTAVRVGLGEEQAIDSATWVAHYHVKKLDAVLSRDVKLASTCAAEELVMTAPLGTLGRDATVTGLNQLAVDTLGFVSEDVLVVCLQLGATMVDGTAVRSTTVTPYISSVISGTRSSVNLLLDISVDGAAAITDIGTIDLARRPFDGADPLFSTVKTGLEAAEPVEVEKLSFTSIAPITNMIAPGCQTINHSFSYDFRRFTAAGASATRCGFNIDGQKVESGKVITPNGVNYTAELSPGFGIAYPDRFSSGYLRFCYRVRVLYEQYTPGQDGTCTNVTGPANPPTRATYRSYEFDADTAPAASGRAMAVPTP